MGRTADSLRACQPLPGGVSGSSAYQVTLDGEQVILKATAADVDGPVLERARREAEFYQRLAHAIPVRVPRVLGTAITPACGVCLLLARYDTCPSPAEWTEPDYLTVSEELGRLHAAFWNQEEWLSQYPWLKVRRTADTSAHSRAAHGYWQALRDEERFRSVLTPQRWRAIQALLRRIEAIDAAFEALPVTLCHGDCHTGNLLQDSDGSLVWADWQEVGIGRGPEDLSFLLQRASAEGGAFCESSLVEAYRESLGTAPGEDLPTTTILAVLHASELRTRLLYWPAYLKDASEPTLERMVERMMDLAGGLNIT
jgi:Ser/Thr protein kinase RdoA (MazF antagonist)